MQRLVLPRAVFVSRSARRTISDASRHATSTASPTTSMTSLATETARAVADRAALTARKFTAKLKQAAEESERKKNNPVL